MRRLDELAAETDEPGRITRLFLTPSHKLAMRRVRGLDGGRRGSRSRTTTSAMSSGACRAPTPDAPIFILGSHIDSVRDAGRYDGGFGVLSAIEVVEELRRRGVELPFALEVVAFGDEEGVRFPATLSGSRALAGTFDFESLDAKDENGISLAEALRRLRLRRPRHRQDRARPRANLRLSRKPYRARAGARSARIWRSASSRPLRACAASTSRSRARPVMPAPCRWRDARIRLRAAPR